MTPSCVNCIVCIAAHCEVCFVSKCTHKMQSCVRLYPRVCDVKHVHPPMGLSCTLTKWILPVQTLLRTLTCNDFV